MADRLLTVVAKLRAKKGKEDEVRAELSKLVAPTKSEDGCIQYDLHESNDEPGVFLFFEIWKSQEHLACHFETPHLQHLKSREAELLVEPVELSLWTRIL